jgi:hypothetical protein
MLGAGRDEERVADTSLESLAIDLEHTASLEDDVDLVVLVRFLTVALRGNELVHPELEARRLMEDLVATRPKLPCDVAEMSALHAASLLRSLSWARSPPKSS